MTDATNAALTTLSYFDSQRAIEVRDSAASLLATYTYGNYVDEALIMINSSGTSYYHPDALWSVAAISDPAGTAMERYTYQGYGLVSVFDGGGQPVAGNPWDTPHSVIGNDLFFTGQRFDSEAGYYYFRARQYLPQAGRFAQRDVPSPLLGRNLYEYASSNPIRRLDPSGTQDELPENQRTIQKQQECNEERGNGTCKYKLVLHSFDGRMWPAWQPYCDDHGCHCQYQIRCWYYEKLVSDTCPQNSHCSSPSTRTDRDGPLPDDILGLSFQTKCGYALHRDEYPFERWVWECDYKCPETVRYPPELYYFKDDYWPTENLYPKGYSHVSWTRTTACTVLTKNKGVAH
jgi:RHS repeat-associated protein